MNKLLKPLLTILIFILLLAGFFILSPRIAQVDEETVKCINTQLEEKEATTSQLDTNKSLPQHQNATITEAIINYSIDNNINYEISLRIANCESKMGKYKVNWEGSSAYGLYQFMPRTFNAYCQGSIESDIDQIICFTKLYKKYPYWWECK